MDIVLEFDIYGDEHVKEDHTCGICGRVYEWSHTDIEALSEQSPFMPCGDTWVFLDRFVGEKTTGRYIV